MKTVTNKTLKADKDILDECKIFYTNLYKSKSTKISQQDNKYFFPLEKETELTEEQKRYCEGTLTEKECFEALKSMENNKSPGSDGLPAEFYKVFWRDINVLYLNAINFGHKIGKLSISQRRGIIKLIPKKSRILQLLKNLRPINLLNCDYKIATKAIANRLKTVLSTLISYDQTGFLKGRSISENIRLIDGILRFSDLENIPGLLLFVDFEKAFDTLEWRFVENVFRYYNFRPSFIMWIKTFYNDIQNAIFNNGWSSGFFNLERGVRQGCPLSPYVFILCVEILSSAIRRDKEIKGVRILKTECKTTQYADDNTLFLDGSNLSLETSLLTFKKFGKISGLKMNNSKTEAMWIGKSKHRTDILFPEKKLIWSVSSVKALTLGVFFSTSEDLSMIQNRRLKKSTKLRSYVIAGVLDD